MIGCDGTQRPRAYQRETSMVESNKSTIEAKARGLLSKEMKKLESWRRGR